MDLEKELRALVKCGDIGGLHWSVEIRSLIADKESANMHSYTCNGFTDNDVKSRDR